jgi:hypothetical protein
MTTEPFFIGPPDLAQPKLRDESPLDIPDFVSSNPAVDHTATARADSRSSGKSNACARTIGHTETNACR